MKNSNFYLAIASTIFIACSGSTNPTPPEEQNHSAKDSIKMSDTTRREAGQQLNTNDFATKAAIGGMMEVESSANMIKSTENPDIQTLATIMVKDHSTANQELAGIAKKEKLNLPLALPQEKVNMMKQMDALHEEEKNRFYADLMVKEHEEAVALFTYASQNEGNIALKNFASQKLPTLKHHLMEAKNVQKIMHSIANDKGDKPLRISKDRSQIGGH
jgi:putative membrane protein